MKRRAFLNSSALTVGGLLLDPSWAVSDPKHADLIVYGGTAAGVIAAVAAARSGARVTLLEPGAHLGGMVSGGLGHTDKGREETVGGLAREFFQKVGRRYGQDIAWDFEPHVAQQVFAELTAEAGVTVLYRHRLKEHRGVEKRGPRILRLLTENGMSFQARMFIDASYEGDLLSQAGVSFTWGREGRSDYDESFAGVRPVDQYAKHWFDVPVCAYGTGHTLLPEVITEPPGKIGDGDKKLQAYNFRLCITRHPANRVPLPKPADYDPRRYTLLSRYVARKVEVSGRAPYLVIMSPLPNGKFDINNYGPFSTDCINRNWDYPTASYRRREEMWQEHADYIAGFLHFIATDANMPAVLQAEVLKWGLAADEFQDTGHWPFQLYVREARRMVGDFVMTQHDAETLTTKHDPIGMGSYNMDSHNVQRYLNEDGTVQNEGDTEVPTTPFQIPYRLLLPKLRECHNLLVPVCVSATHAVYGALRLEPVYMMMGEAAGIAARMALERDGPVQGIDTGELTKRLRANGAVMEWRSPEHVTGL